MTPNPILKVLSILKRYQVKALLIGGQACIIYGAAEFSRDSDFVILSTAENIASLKKALKALKAESVYVPPLEISYLERGHACHFRCNARDVKGLRVDIISKLRGCQDFEQLWSRRKGVRVKGVNIIDVISLQDLVQSKKTQRDKDWLMLKRLVDNDILLNDCKQSKERIKWWFQECRDSDLLLKLAKRYPDLVNESLKSRPLLSSAIVSDIRALDSQLRDEELAQRQKDIEYWTPLRSELEALRHAKRHN